MAMNAHAKAFRAYRERNAAREFEELYRQSYPSVYNFVYYRMLDSQTAEDVTADAFLRAARFFDRFDPSRASFTTWVKAIARNCINQHYRKARPTVPIEDVAESAFAENFDEAERVADAELVKSLLATLEETDREMLFLKYYEGMRNVDIARELDMNESTVATRLQRALAKMKSSAARRQ